MTRYYSRYEQYKRVEELKRDIVKLIRDYMVRWGKPTPYYHLGRKYGACLKYYGTSFREVVNILADQGLIRTSLTEDCKELLSPGLVNWDDLVKKASHVKPRVS